MSEEAFSATDRRGGCVMRRPAAGRQILSRRNFAAIAVAIVFSLPVYAQDVAPVCHARAVNTRSVDRTRTANTEAGGPSLCLYRGPTTVHVEVRQTSIASILSALAGAYKISYRSSVPLTEIRSGKYTGRLQSVISDVLDGYDYAVKHENSAIAVIVFNKSGGEAVAAAQPAPAPVANEANQTATATPPAKKTRGEVTVSRSH
jgi:hypothetical protein